MPWSVQTPMTQRREFIADAQRRLYSMAELCARYHLSRRVDYKWLAHYEAEDLTRLEDRSRRPHASPQQLDVELAALLLAARRAHPTWCRGSPILTR